MKTHADQPGTEQELITMFCVNKTNARQASVMPLIQKNNNVMDSSIQNHPQNAYLMDSTSKSVLTVKELLFFKEDTNSNKQKSFFFKNTEKYLSFNCSA